MLQVAPISQGDSAHHDLLIRRRLHRPHPLLHLLRRPHHPCGQDGHHGARLTGIFIIIFNIILYQRLLKVKFFELSNIYDVVYCSCLEKQELKALLDPEFSIY